MGVGKPASDQDKSHVSFTYSKGQSGERESQIECIHFFFLLFARRIKGGASQAGSGLGPQWNLPELAATPGSAGCWSENVASSQMCQGSVYTGGPQAGQPACTTIFAGNWEKETQVGRQRLPNSPPSFSLILPTPCRY